VLSGLWCAVIAEMVQEMAPKSKQQHVMPFCGWACVWGFHWLYS